jgi:hypothetical protein
VSLDELDQPSLPPISPSKLRHQYNRAVSVFGLGHLSHNLRQDHLLHCAIIEVLTEYEKSLGHRLTQSQRLWVLLEEVQMLVEVANPGIDGKTISESPGMKCDILIWTDLNNSTSVFVR